eukprot:CAMPEP_0198552072 /NCGR_PEP_ID=MMETSP1462-20131121/77945_1 /TAXON_ID=1333877 /ORGANISM="Brandtodinium nutriculum, Strain RCC3387" /LENGTH=93 /DNA_ID=CAMNT_0044282721 /DNA_START=117 /DNA_END=394 /DNA_ORIENTATION=+
MPGTPAGDFLSSAVCFFISSLAYFFFRRENLVFDVSVVALDIALATFEFWEIACGYELTMGTLPMTLFGVWFSHNVLTLCMTISGVHTVCICV